MTIVYVSDALLRYCRPKSACATNSSGVTMRLSDELVTKGVLAQLGVVAHIELRQDMSVVRANGFHAEKELPGNFLCSPASCDP